MAVVTSDLLEALLTNHRALFAREFSAAEQLQGWQNLAIRTDSMVEYESYNWFGTVPQMQDVTSDAPDIRGLDRYTFTLRNRAYQAAVELERAALERDQFNIITPRIAQMGGEAARHPGSLLLSLFEAPGDAYDGDPFFGTTRVIGESGNIDNHLTGTVGHTTAVFQANLEAARGTMLRYQDDRGRPMHLRPNVIVCPPEKTQLIFQSLNVQQAGNLDRAVVPTSQTGVFQAGTYLVVENAYLTDPDDFYVLHVGGPGQRPFVWQVEKMPVLESDTNPMTRENILQRNFLYSVYGRYAVGVTDPRLAIKVEWAAS